MISIYKILFLLLAGHAFVALLSRALLSRAPHDALADHALAPRGEKGPPERVATALTPTSLAEDTPTSLPIPKKDAEVKEPAERATRLKRLVSNAPVVSQFTWHALGYVQDKGYWTSEKVNLTAYLHRLGPSIVPGAAVVPEGHPKPDGGIREHLNSVYHDELATVLESDHGVWGEKEKKNCPDGPLLWYVVRGHYRTFHWLAGHPLFHNIKANLQASVGDCWFVVGMFPSRITGWGNHADQAIFDKTYKNITTNDDLKKVLQKDRITLDGKFAYAVVQRKGWAGTAGGDLSGAKPWAAYHVHNHGAWVVAHEAAARNKIPLRPEAVVVLTRPDIEANHAKTNRLRVDDLQRLFALDPHQVVGQQVSSDNYQILSYAALERGIGWPLEAGLRQHRDTFAKAWVLQSPENAYISLGVKNYWQRSYKYFEPGSEHCACLSAVMNNISLDLPFRALGDVTSARFKSVARQPQGKRNVHDELQPALCTSRSEQSCYLRAWVDTVMHGITRFRSIDARLAANNAPNTTRQAWNPTDELMLLDCGPKQAKPGPQPLVRADFGAPTTNASLGQRK